VRLVDYVNLGKAGLKVSRICLGCMSYGTPAWRPWVLDERASRPFFERAVEHGINFFDTADMYSKGVSEEVTGRALRDLGKREQVVIATKVFYQMGEGPNERGLSRKHLFDAIDGSLRRLGVDYVDLYQIHRWDYSTPIDETLRALDDIVRAGKARYIGASSMFVYQFARALATADARGWTRFVSMQNHYNLAYREEEREMIPFCVEEGIGLIPWSPLARGLLAGNRTREAMQASAAGGPPARYGAGQGTGQYEGETTRARSDAFAQELYYHESDFDVAERCAELAARRGVRPAQIALAWLLHKPAVTAPIIGATKLQHLEDAVAALAIKLTPEEIRSLEEPYQPHPVLGHE
jgi:aryl-alcohol dehydrogenase-like predicted oxidoreductase